MIDELAPLPDKVGGACRVWERADLLANPVTDGAGTGAVSARWRGPHVAVGGRGKSRELDTRAAQVQIRFIVSSSVDRSNLGMRTPGTDAGKCHSQDYRELTRPTLV